MTDLEVAPDEEPSSETKTLLDELILTQLGRSRALVHDFHTQVVHWPAHLGAHIRHAVLGNMEELRGQLVDGEITRAKVDEIRRKANRRRLAQRAIQLPSRLRAARLELSRALSSMLGETRIEHWRQTLGLPLPESARTLDRSLFLKPTTTVQLPPAYRRLFAAEALESSDALIGRETSIERARNALENKGNSTRLRSVVLVGFDGVGKRSVASAVVRSGRWKKVERLRFDRPQTIADLQETLQQVSKSQLIVLENPGWLLSAQPEGFAPLRFLVNAIIEDAGKRAWLLCAESLWWTYANAIAPLDNAFPEKIDLKRLEPEELQAAVMARHRLSGFGHVFDRRESESPIENLIIHGASQIRRPFEQYFHDLHIATGGLLQDALRLWLSSIRGIDSSEIIRLGPVPTSNFAAIRRLPKTFFWFFFKLPGKDG